MINKLKPIRCGCGGEAEIFHIAPEGYEGSYCVRCTKCLTQTPFFNKDKNKAIEVWNRAMSARYVTDEVFDKIKDKVVEDVLKSMKIERTAKVVNITHVRGYPPEGECSNCGYDVIDDGYYCPGCGCRLEWE